MPVEQRMPRQDQGPNAKFQNVPNITQPIVPNVVPVPEIPVLLPVDAAPAAQPVVVPGYFDEVPGIRLDPMVQVDRVPEPEPVMPVVPENIVLENIQEVHSPMRNRLRRNVGPPIRYGW